VGYWWPPSLFAFDPHERPLAWAKLPVSQAREALSKITGLPLNMIDASFPNPAAEVVIPGEYDLDLLPRLAQTPFGKNRGGLAVYYSMLSNRAPEDPPGGGLAADTVNADGSITVNYWDFADGNRVYRKRVTYIQDQKTGQATIANRYDAEGGVPQMFVNGVWQKEGADAEREFGKAGLQIINAMGSIAAAVLALVPGAQVAATAFGIMWSFTMKQLANGGKPPDASDVINLVGSITKVVGPGVWGIVSSSPDFQNVFKNGFIGKMAELPGKWSDKIAGAVNDLGQAFPKIDLPKLFSGFDAQKWMNGELKKLPTPTAAMQGLIGTPGHEVDIGALAAINDPRGTAFTYAAKAFAEPDADARALIRRNFLWLEVFNSSAIEQGNPQGVGAHAEKEVDDGLMSAGSFFDQYLAAMLQSGIGIGQHLASQALAGGPVTDLRKLRLSDVAAQNALADFIRTLMNRYHMV
jgi:hypothetical protein